MDAHEQIIAISKYMPRRIAGELVSFAGLRGRSVVDRTGRHVGRLTDLVIRLDTEDSHPLVHGALVRVGTKLHYIPEAAIVGVRDRNLFLCTVGLTPRTIPADEHLVRLAHHVLLSAPSRVSDIILACSVDAIRLVGIDTTVRTLLRVLVPTPIRRRVHPHRLQPWAPLGAPRHLKPSDAPTTIARPRPTSTPLPRASQPTSTPVYTPYTRRSRSQA